MLSREAIGLAKNFLEANYVPAAVTGGFGRKHLDISVCCIYVPD
jgi:hypothetical protein